jgi:hypothetical protein
MVQIKLSVAFILASAAIAPVVALPFPAGAQPPSIDKTSESVTTPKSDVTIPKSKSSVTNPESSVTSPESSVTSPKSSVRNKAQLEDPSSSSGTVSSDAKGSNVVKRVHRRRHHHGAQSGNGAHDHVKKHRSPKSAKSLDTETEKPAAGPNGSAISKKPTGTSGDAADAAKKSGSATSSLVPRSDSDLFERSPDGEGNHHHPQGQGGTQHGERPHPHHHSQDQGGNHHGPKHQLENPDPAAAAAPLTPRSDSELFERSPQEVPQQEGGGGGKEKGKSTGRVRVRARGYDLD